MKKYAVRLAAIALLAAVAALVLGLAAPAGAADSYTPALAPTAQVAPKVAVAAAAYTPKIAAKRAARIARAQALSTTTSTSTSSGSEDAKARAILAGLIAKYPILKGTTVSIGDARGYQAIAYYQSGRIVISRTHTATLERILNHEVWHVIDYRDNGKINWGENVPPSNASSYRG